MTFTGRHEGDLRYSLRKLVFQSTEFLSHPWGERPAVLFPKGYVGEQRSFSRDSSLKGKPTELEEWRLASSLATLRPHPAGDLMCTCPQTV